MQFQTWRVCQLCGRSTSSDQTEHWLISPHKYDRNVTVVRCPQHWSEWALRHCRDGRTRVMRDRMREALSLPAPPIPAFLSPFPTKEKESGKQET